MIHQTDIAAISRSIARRRRSRTAHCCCCCQTVALCLAPIVRFLESHCPRFPAHSTKPLTCNGTACDDTLLPPFANVRLALCCCAFWSHSSLLRQTPDIRLDIGAARRNIVRRRRCRRRPLRRSWGARHAVSRRISRSLCVGFLLIHCVSVFNVVVVAADGDSGWKRVGMKVPRHRGCLISLPFSR